MMSKKKNTCFEYEINNMWKREIFLEEVTIEEIQSLNTYKEGRVYFIDGETLQKTYVTLTSLPATINRSIHELYSSLLKKGEYNIHGSNKSKTVTLKFHGQSDDTFGEYGETYQDYANCASGKPIQCIIDCEEHGRLLVVGQYSPDLSSGCWVISIGKVEDADAFPEWKMKLGECQHVPYSMELEIEIPNCDFDLKWYDNGKLVV